MRLHFSFVIAVIIPLYVACWSMPAVAQDSVSDRIARATKKMNQKQLYKLEYKLNKGDEIRWDFEQVVSVKFQMAGEVEETSSRSQNRKHWKVANVDDLGNITFVFTVESIEMWQQIGEGEPVAYNSQTDTKVPDEYVGSADHVGKPLAIFSISPDGRVLDRKSSVKEDKLGVGKVTIPLPKTAVAVGHKWDIPIVLEATDENGRNRKLKARILYELAKVKDQNAYISFRTEVLTPVNSQKIKSTIMQKMTKGITVFDMKLGHPRMTRIEWDEKAQGFEGPDSYLKYVGRMTEKLVADASGDSPGDAALSPLKEDVAKGPVKLKTKDDAPIMRK